LFVSGRLSALLFFLGGGGFVLLFKSFVLVEGCES